MFGQFFIVVKNSVLFLAALGFLVALGNATNALIDWSWLTSFFSILKYFASILSFAWDVETTWTLVGYVFLYETAVWGFRAGMFVVGYFKTH